MLRELDQAHQERGSGDGVLRPNGSLATTPDSIDFWRSLYTDLLQTAGKSTLRNFFLHYHPSNTQETRMWRGKYSEMFVQFGKSESDDKYHAQRLDQFVSKEFVPPKDDNEFNRVVYQTRALLREKFHHRRTDMWNALEKLDDPEFWSEFSSDLSLLEDNVSFGQFLRFFDPDDPQVIKDQLWVRGKYRGVYTALHSAVAGEALTRLTNRVNATRLDSLKTSEEVAKMNPKERDQILYDAAPPEVKMQLNAHFPKEFGGISLEDLENNHSTIEQLSFILEGVGLLRADSREHILKAVAEYVLVLQLDGGVSFSSSDVSKMLSQAAEKIGTDLGKKDGLRLEEVLNNNQRLSILIDQAESDDPLTADAAKELLNSLTEHYYLPLFRTLLYKPVSLFWSSFLAENPDMATVPPNLLMDFAENYYQEKIDGADQVDQDKKVLQFFNSQVLPQVYQRFGEVASFASQIDHFKKTDEKGNPKHLFFHQVEGMQELIEDQGGILSDEPGTGKTVILALAALALMDRKVGMDRPSRMLVVGTKSVIDNWEKELGLHIDCKNLNVINLNFPEEREEEGMAEALRIRLGRLARDLSNTLYSKQFALVNYDVFRRPDFQAILDKFQFDITTIDEAHNVKSRFFESIDSEMTSGERSRKVARRTSGLYGFLRGNPDMVVFLATATPFVKSLIEPLIMAHLVNPEKVKVKDIVRMMHDSLETHRTLSSMLLRRRKEEIADLPPKETRFIPIDLNTLSEADKATFIGTAKGLVEKYPTKFARFYSILALEAQAKYPWLIEKVNELTSQGKKVVIFSPFVAGEDRHTAGMSTAMIASKLREAGINSVGIIDGSIDERQRKVAQESFLRKNGIGVLVGNYLMAGESITLNSPENRATEVILFVAPNTISRYLQAIDRVHRFGQNEKVTIHVPFLTGDLLGRTVGTYDERVVKRIADDLAKFGEVIDGLFFVESKDFYQSAADVEPIRGGVEFNIRQPVREVREKALGEVLDKVVHRRGRKRINTTTPEGEVTPADNSTWGEKKAATGTKKPKKEREEKPIEVDVDLSKRSVFGNLDLDTEGIYQSAHDENVLSGKSLQIYMEQAKQYPQLTAEQERVVIKAMQEGQSLGALVKSRQLSRLIPFEDREKFKNVLSDSKTIEELLINSNLMLVASRMHKHHGLPMLDLLQEGNLGLKRAIEKFDAGRGGKLSTYAIWWIDQAMSRAVGDQARTIRLPVHMAETIGKVRRVATEFKQKEGYDPDSEELRAQLELKTDLNETEINNALTTLSTGVLRPYSLNASLREGSSHPGRGGASETELEEVTSDPSLPADVVYQEVEDNDLQVAVRTALQGLDNRSKQVLEMRFGLDDGRDKTLEEVGQHFGVTRERIRQIEAKGLQELKRNSNLKKRWEDDLPSFVYGRSAESAAIKLGLFKDFHAPSTAVFERPPKPETPPNPKQDAVKIIPAKQDVVDSVMKDPVLSERVSDIERSILNLYLRSKGNFDVLRPRLGIILGMSSGEVNKAIDDTIKHAEEILIDSKVERIVSNEPEIMNTDIKEKLATELNYPVSAISVQRSRARVAPNGRTHGTIIFSAPSPTEAGIRRELGEYQNGAVDYSSIARKAGVTSGWVRQIHEAMKQESQKSEAVTA